MTNAMSGSTSNTNTYVIVSIDKENIRKYKKYKHEGIIYDCDQSDINFIHKNYLTDHKPFKHNGITFSVTYVT